MMVSAGIAMHSEEHGTIWNVMAKPFRTRLQMTSPIFGLLSAVKYQLTLLKLLLHSR